MSQELILHKGQTRGKEYPKVTKDELRAIKKIIGWPPTKPFARCIGKVHRFVKRCEEKGDFSHSDKDHLCGECQCKLRKGQSTKGNFYGLGEHTGHIGVGYCYRCSIGVPMSGLIEQARSDLRAYQIAGNVEDTVQRYEQAAIEESKEAELLKQGRQDLELVYKTLQNFKALVEDGRLTEKYKNGPDTASDVTRIKLALDIASTISKLKLDAFTLDSKSYIHFDEFKIRMPQYFNLFKRLMMKFRELEANKQPGDPDPMDVVYDEFILGHKQIWQNVRTGAK